MGRLYQAYDIHSRWLTRETCRYFCEEEGVEAGKSLDPEKALLSMLCTGKMEQEMELESSIAVGELGRELANYIAWEVREMGS